jgi:hypothetical protein
VARIVSSAFRPLWLGGINAAPLRPTQGLGSWLLNGNYQFFSTVENGAFEVVPNVYRDLVSSFAFDTNRFAVAAFENMYSIHATPHLSKSIGAALQVLYYAAFFGAHALIRVTGASCSYFNTESIGRANQISDLFGTSEDFKISTGFYDCKISDTPPKLRCVKREGSASGSHAILWQTFLSLLDESLEFATDGSSVIDDSVVIQLSSLRHILTLSRSAKGNWLSNMRNELTYQHGFGVWFPYSSAIDASGIYRICRSWTKGGLAVKLDSLPDLLVEQFAGACATIVGLCFDVLTDIFERSPAGRRSFLIDGPLRLTTQMAAD